MEIKLSAAPAFYVIYLMVLNPNSDSVPLCFIRLSVFSPNHPVNHARIAIDMKSFYASVECVARGYDPLTTNLLVADESRSDQTICLAVSPSLKAIGVPSRPRLFEAKQAIQKYEREHRTKVHYITAIPRMAEYERISSLIYSIILR